MLQDCKVVTIPKFADIRGSLSFVEANKHIPFEIKRIYYLYDIAEGAARAGHGHKTLQQLIIALSGSFTVSLYDGHATREYELNRPDVGLYIPKMMWRDLNRFSDSAVCLVLASELYDEADYFRDRKQFANAVNSRVSVE